MDFLSIPMYTTMGNHHQRPWNRDGFEIAIICALPRETNAVLCAMDEIWHDSRHYYGKIPGDDNSYDFGRIGSHCVVIVTLPTMGSVPASSASRSLKMSFSSIKLALLVGICGAVPFKKDGGEIVLGDVIISETIVELDYGRQYPNGFRRKDALIEVHGRPNEEILGLLQRWKIPTILETLRHGSMKHLKYLLQGLNIDYPGVSQDTLFKPDYIHKHHGDCVECSNSAEAVCDSALASSCSNLLCDGKETVRRIRLEETIKSRNDTPNPSIHIGSIGTGNAVMKSGQHRDQYAQSEGIIAFEMEGVGVWDKFSCLVIKGACDYADSHKSKIWQDYAAVVAAAVAKEVLEQYVMPQKSPQPVIPYAAISHYTGGSLPALDSRLFQSSGTILHAVPRFLSHGFVEESGERSGKEMSGLDAQQRIIASLRFPQMQERAHQIEAPHNQTYEWIVQAQDKQTHGWDDLVAWLSSSTETRRIYWVSGKPGSGKSTLMRFLAERLDVQEHMRPWTQGCSIIRASYYSWSPGNMLQKSLEGLLRSLLLQILEQKPDLIPEVIDSTRWGADRMKVAEWSNVELLSSLRRCISGLAKLSIRVLILVDGLDEFECTDEIRQELIQIFISLACTENVKMLLSSRPWNIFQDSFSEMPKIRLEDLTREDITSYVRTKFFSNARFQYLHRCGQAAADALISAVTDKAEGVFLWVRLVVRDLLKGLRDGDGIHSLYHSLEQIPADLDDYFERLLSSIDPPYRREASIILQVALHEEHDFTALHPLRLLDLSLTDEPNPGFASGDYLKHRRTFMDNVDELRFLLDSTVRRVNSRCMGLLECTYSPDTFFDLFGDWWAMEIDDDWLFGGSKFEPSIYSKIFDEHYLFRSFMLTVDFLHRCCRDFLLSPNIQSLLRQYTEGRYDARMFLVNSRMTQFLALQTAGRDQDDPLGMDFSLGMDISLGIASYLISALSVPEWRETKLSIRAAEILQPALKSFLSHYHGSTYAGWYIDRVLTTWHEERSNFLTLAIDFDMRGYCMAYLNEDQIKSKEGRPILDYILRPRFETDGDAMNIWNSVPRIELLHRVLTLGADPNSLYCGVSVWALFLSSTADWLRRGINTSAVNKQAYFVAMEMMIDRGATLILPCSWVLGEGPKRLTYSENYRLHYRWPKDLPIVEQTITRPSQPNYAVTDLLETFRVYFGPTIDGLIALAKARINAAQHTNLNVPGN